MEIGVECMWDLTASRYEEVIVLSTWDRKWQRMEAVKGIWYSK